jgi:HPt (histidine-containing phosphotransfer) domain-containing protein
VSGSDRGPLRLLVLEGDAADADAATAMLPAALGADLEIVRAAVLTEALRRLDAPPAIDVVLLDPELRAVTVLEAFGALHAHAPDVPVVVLPGVTTDHLAAAIRTVTRSAQGGAAAARRIAALLPRYLVNRERDVATLRGALERQDFEPIARIGHNLRGNGVSFGIPEFSSIGERLEAAALARSGSDLEEPIALLQMRLDRILGR